VLDSSDGFVSLLLLSYILPSSASGLDSRAAVVVMRIVSKIAATGRSVLCTSQSPLLRAVKQGARLSANAPLLFSHTICRLVVFFLFSPPTFL